MAYTSKQLTMAWTAVHNGLAPDEATQKNIDVFAGFNASGSISDANALAYVLNSGDDSTALAALSYQFFTGKSPTKAGFDYLLNSPTNPNDLNDAYYAKFNIENRYINFAANLGVQGEGAADFAAKYGAMSFSDYVASIYETIIGSTYAKAAGVDVTAAIAYLVGTKDAVLATARSAGMVTDGMTPAQIDLALKAAMAGLVMAAAVKSDIGVYAAAANNFMLAMVQDKAVYGADLAHDYGPTSGKGSTGDGKAVSTTPAPADLPGAPKPPPPPPEPEPEPEPVSLAFVLTNQTDRFTGDVLADTFTATHDTWNAGDVLDGGLGADSLTLTAATGGIYVLPGATVANIETATITNDRSLDIDTRAWTGLTRLTLNLAGQVDASVATTTDLVVNNTDQRGGDVQMSGGHDVTVNVSRAVGGSITIGDMTGAVVINQENATASVGDIQVTGGSSVKINQTAASGGGFSDARVLVFGSALTTSVVVNGSTNAANARVEIHDVNGQSAAVSKITSIEADHFFNLNIYDNNLSTLKLGHSQQATNIWNAGLATPAATTLNLTVNGLGSGAVLKDQGIYTTLNITTGAEASDLDLDMTRLTTLSVSGDSDLSLTSLQNSPLETIRISGAGQVDGLGNLAAFSALTSFDASGSGGDFTLTADATRTAVRTGSGDDMVTLTATATIDKLISTGDGDDTVDLSATTASNLSQIAIGVDGGGGVDTLVLKAANAVSLSAQGGFTSKFLGFERLALTNVSSGTLNLSGTGIHHVTLSGGSHFILSGMSSGDTVVVNDNGSFFDMTVGPGLDGVDDTLNLVLEDRAGGSLEFSPGLNTQRFEHIDITTLDGSATPVGAMETLTLASIDVKTIVARGNAGLKLFTHVGSIVESIDASGITLGGLDLTLRHAAAPITIKGSATADNVIDLSNATTSAISYVGGAGDDTVTVSDGSVTLGVHLDGGDGTNDVLKMSVTALAAVTPGSITGFEHLILTGASNQTIDLTRLSGVHHVTSDGGSGLVFDGFAAGDTLTLNGANTLTTVQGSFATVTDIFNLNLVDSSGSARDFGEIATVGVDVLNVDIAHAGAFQDSLKLTGNPLGTIVITSDAGVALTTDPGPFAGVYLTMYQLDASGVAGDFSWSNSNLQAPFTIKGSATGDNTIVVGTYENSFSAYTGGSGDDDVTIISGGAISLNLGDGTNTVHAIRGVGITSGSGDDTFTLKNGGNSFGLGSGDDTIVYTAGTSSVGRGDAIRGLGAGDKIELPFALGITSFGAPINTSVYAGGFQEALVSQFQGDGATTPIVRWFRVGPDSYLFIDHGDGDFQNFAETDYSMRLVGIPDLSTATVSGGTILFH